jgi:hypothetical protein
MWTDVGWKKEIKERIRITADNNDLWNEYYDSLTQT